MSERLVPVKVEESVKNRAKALAARLGLSIKDWFATVVESEEKKGVNDGTAKPESGAGEDRQS